MVYSLLYRRPSLVSSKRLSSIGSKKTQSISDSISSNSSTSTLGIPDALSFDRVVSGGTCPPCTMRDFMNYLIYIERAAENLQFFLWYRDYTKRFTELPEGKRALSPAWVMEKAEADTTAGYGNLSGQKKPSADAAAIFKDTDFAVPKVSVVEYGGNNPFHTPPHTPETGRESIVGGSEYGWDDGTSTLQSTTGKSFHRKANEAFEAANVKVQPFTIQPFREEITRVIATYISDDGARQLNLSSKERSEVLQALASTTNPTAFANVIHTIEWSLRHQAHPNFIRWSICNGNRPRVIFARGLGVFLILAGLITAILITLSHVGRGWRALSAIAFLLGISTLIAAWKGMCVVLHGMHHRHIRPWELFADDDDAASQYEMKRTSFDSFGSSNSYEDEPWVVKYEKRNVIRKVFDKEVWIQEPALRQIQDTIFVQSLLGAAVLAAVLVGIFIAIPKGRMY